MTSIVAATNVEALVCNCDILNKVFNEDRELHQPKIRKQSQWQSQLQ